MPFNRPTLLEIEKRVTTDLSSIIKGNSPRVSFKKLLAKAISGCSHMLHGHIAHNDGIFMPDTDSEKYILRWANILRITRKPGDFAKGFIEIDSEPDLKIRPGTELKHLETKYLYIVTEEIVTSKDKSVLPVKCLTIGKIGNRKVGEKLELTTTISGVSNPVVKSISGGSDLESLDSLQKRYLFKLANPSSGGDDASHINIALNIKHITRAYVFPEFKGVGTTGVSFLFDDLKENPIPDPDSEDFKQAKKEIISNCPSLSRQGLSVFPPKEFPLLVSAKIEIKKGEDLEKIKKEIEDGIKDLIRFETHIAGAKVIGTPYDQYDGIIFKSHLSNIFSNSGVRDYEIIHPKTNIIPKFGEIVIFKGVNWNE